MDWTQRPSPRGAPSQLIGAGKGGEGPPQGPVLGLHSDGRRCLPGQEAVSWQGWPPCPLKRGNMLRRGTHPRPCCHTNSTILWTWLVCAGFSVPVVREILGGPQLPQEVDRQAPPGTHNLSATTEPTSKRQGGSHPSGLGPGVLWAEVPRHQGDSETSPGTQLVASTPAALGGRQTQGSRLEQ